MKNLLLRTTAATVLVPALASAEPVGAETAYLFDTLFALICGVLVMFMAAGFAMLEAGMVRSKSVAVILAKNISLYSIASIVFFLVGYELMYGSSVAGLYGEFKAWAAAEVPGGREGPRESPGGWDGPQGAEDEPPTPSIAGILQIFTQSLLLKNSKIEICNKTAISGV